MVEPVAAAVTLLTFIGLLVWTGRRWRHEDAGYIDPVRFRRTPERRP
jgi:hypothetical protein